MDSGAVIDWSYTLMVGNGIVLTVFGYLWSIIDAHASARHINRKLIKEQVNLVIFDNDKYALGFDIGQRKRGIGAGHTLHF